MSVQISIVHYAESNELQFNDTLVLLVKSIRALTKYRPYRLNIIDNQMHPKAREDLRRKLPKVEILRTSGKHHTFPVGANLAMDKMKGDYLVMFHTDLLVTWNWLTSLVQNLKWAEKTYGAPCATSPLLTFHPRRNASRVKSVKKYMDKHSIPYKMWGKFPVAISKPGEVTDNGWRLGGAYMASKRFFREVGHYDPLINRMNDKSYSIKALMTRCRHTVSNHVWLHHVGGLHKSSGCYIKGPYGTRKLGAYAQFKLKWGHVIFKKVQNGSLWPELHRAQRAGNARQLVKKYMKQGAVKA
ncbi:hypothetical protein ES702_07751 [subsurface metagenome]